MEMISICQSLVVLYQIWTKFAYTILLMQNSIRSRKEMETFCKKIEMLLLVNLSFLNVKQLLMKRLFEGLQTCANLLFGLMPGKYVPICQPMPPGLFSRWDFDSKTSRFTP